MRVLYALGTLAVAALSGLLVLAAPSAPAHSYSFGAPPMFSGPENYCNACHGSPTTNPVNSGTGAVTITAPATYAAGETIPISVTVTNTSVLAGPTLKQGFELSARDAALATVGTFTVDGTTVQFAQGDPDYVTHTTASNTDTTWVFSWTAPTTAVPASVTLYAAGNAANGNGFGFGDDGDKIYSDSLVMTLAASAPVAAAMAPTSSTTVAASGGSITYRVTLTNTTSQTQTFDAWTEAVLPNGSVFGPVEGPRALTLGPNATLGPVTLRINVPRAAPTGTYTYRLRLGDYPGTVSTETSFTFTKAASARLASATATPVVGEGDFLAAASMRAGEVPALLTTAPNPFAASTMVRFAVPESGLVRLAVYDLLGREVAVLADGPFEPGTHAATFDGRGLATGVYVLRFSVGSAVQAQRVVIAR